MTGLFAFNVTGPWRNGLAICVTIMTCQRNHRNHVAAISDVTNVVLHLQWLSAPMTIISVILINNASMALLQPAFCNVSYWRIYSTQISCVILMV